MSKITETVNKTKSLYHNNLWQGRLLLSLLIILLVLAVVRLSLSKVIIFSAVYWLNNQGISAHIEDVSIRIYNGTFSVLGAKGTKNGDTVFNIGKASIDWAWRPLTSKNIHILGIELDDFNLNAEQYSDALVIAGVVIRPDGTIEQDVSSEEDTIDWGTSLNQIDFSNLSFCYRQYSSALDSTNQDESTIDYCGNIDLFTWQGDFNFGQTGAAKDRTGMILTANGAIDIKQLKLYNNTLAGTLAQLGDLSLTNLQINGVEDIKLDKLSLAELILLQDSGHARHKQAVKLDQLELAGVSVSNGNTVSIESVSLNKPVVSMAKDESGKYKYERWLLEQQEALVKESTPQEQKAEASPVNIKLADISITDTELCYQQQTAASEKDAGALDYCLNLAKTQWNGNVAITLPSGEDPVVLDIQGNLALGGMVTTNNALNRDLISFEQLAIDSLAVKGTEDLGFGRLELANVTGLELINTEDKHTVTVASLDLSAFSYRSNTLSVDKLAVNDLGIEVTQSEDGSLEIDQWRLDDTGQQAKAETKTDEPAGEAIKIKVGEFNLDTTRLLQFSDLSVTPNMLVGLKELHFNIKNLDSEKPEQKSPLELSAKTTRHGTIEIKGVVMPFEPKPSFDATGKVTGLDLRVASPKVEQAAGHIIKSGQMDADLKLLSEAGQLDSNIALVLHHFKLKAKSKEDAEELDKTFGMPINQSLMLLKDKKGRIKLDIPITGDINNPEFDPTNAIIKATTKATTVTLITFYTPYGLAYAGGNILFDLATSMNFDPLPFEPGSAELNADHEQQLDKLAELLVERPGVHLTLCGLTNLNDREKMFTEIIDKEKIKPASADRLAKLKQLGSKRQESVKNHLVNAGKIEHNRLILCAPEHNDDTVSISGVEISI